METKHNIPLKTQSSSSNCVQTSVSQFLSFYDIELEPDDIEEKIPVRLNEDKKPMGTLLPDIAAWFKTELNINTKMHVFDVQIIDPSWNNLSKEELKKKIKLLKKGVATSRTPYTDILIKSYNDYVDVNGDIEISKCTNSLLQQLIQKGPILAIINFNYLYDYSRVKYDFDKKNYVRDSFEGKVIEHAIVITGFDKDYYYFNDPDSEMGGQNRVEKDIMIGSICSAQIDSMNFILVVEKN